MQDHRDPSTTSKQPLQWLRHHLRFEPVRRQFGDLTAYSVIMLLAAMATIIGELVRL